jgi:uncharacterized Zn-binding protein involved in type VI secretion
MGQPAAKKGDQISATDMHLIQPPGSAPPVLVPHPFMGMVDGGLSADVKIMGMPAATVDSTATNTPSHLPQGGSFVMSPSNRATIKLGSSSVKINGKAAARNGDMAETCNDPADLPVGTVVASGTVMIGG